MEHHHHAPLLFGALSFFVYGLATSLHCLGMCVPLTCAVCPQGSKKQMSVALAGYHIWRLIAYSMMGYLAVKVGDQLFSQWQSNRLMLVFVGAIVFVTGLLTFRFWPKIASAIIPVKMRGILSAHLLGFFTPLLPCGMLYVAITASTMAPTPFFGATWMASFAVGTLFLMLVGQGVIQFVGFKLTRLSSTKLRWGLVVLSAIMFGYMLSVHR